jgi:uncharacterized membrane protein
MSADSGGLPTARLGTDAAALAGLFLVSGVMHFVRSEMFESIVPKSLPNRRALVHVSGVAEIACAAGLLLPSTRRVAGLTSAAVLVAVFPANVTMTAQAARRVQRDPGNRRKQGYLAVTVTRLPMQWPMIRAALRAGGVLQRRA